MEKIPSFAEEVVLQVRSLVPDAMFTVSYCSTDPILHCTFGAGSSLERHALCVWDFDSDGVAYSVAPPL